MNRAFLGAYRKGLNAGRQGKSWASNPYNKYDVCRGGPTFAKAFHGYWLNGWQDGRAGCDCQNPCPDDSRMYREGGVWYYSNMCPIHGDEKCEDCD
jgi:ribosome modulation factor